MLNSLLVAVDGSEHAERALGFACELARTYKSRLFILSVYRHHSLQESSHSLVRGKTPPEPPDAALGEQAKAIVDEACTRARGAGVDPVEGLVRRGPPARTILTATKEHAVDAVVLGNRGLGDITGFLLGSVSHKVASLAECTCITVK